MGEGAEPRTPSNSVHQILIVTIAILLAAGGSFFLIAMLLSDTKVSTLRIVNAYAMLGAGGFISVLASASRRRKNRP